MRAILKDAGETSRDDPSCRFWNEGRATKYMSKIEGTWLQNTSKGRRGAVVSSGLSLARLFSSVFVLKNL